MITNAENFLSMKWKQLSSNLKNPEGSMIYRGYYNNISIREQKDIFSLIHSRLNDLFTFMNQKNAGNKHYNADESRELINVSSQLSSIHTVLKDEYVEYSFEINSYYKNVLDQCKIFLSTIGGSEIPEDFQEIEIIDYKPIFTLSGIKTLPSSNGGKSVIKKLIGGGSYADVFKYKDPYYNCYFAIKKAKKDLCADELERFKNEFRDLEGLDSPYIIKGYHYDGENNEYTMELASCTLYKYISEKNTMLSFNNRRALVIQLLNAFEYIHSKDLLHRDVSFHNILVKIYEDESSWLKVADFGLVKRPNSDLTRKGTSTKGTINDFSDLNVVGFENYEIRHETYALAQVVYFILTGRKNKYQREKNNELQRFVLKAVSGKSNRFTSVEEMRSELLNMVFPSLKNERAVWFNLDKDGVIDIFVKNKFVVNFVA